MDRAGSGGRGRRALQGEYLEVAGLKVAVQEETYEDVNRVDMSRECCICPRFVK